MAASDSEVLFHQEYGNRILVAQLYYSENSLMYPSDVLPQNEGIFAPVEDDGGQVGRGEGVHPSRTTNLGNEEKSLRGKQAGLRV